jgi:uncharacterized protein (DUF362 family)
MNMSKVILVEGDNRRRAIREAVSGLGSDFIDMVKAARRIFIKVNLEHYELPLPTTHIDAVRGLLDEIRQYSRVDILIGDAAHYGTGPAFTNFGYDRLPAQYEHLALVDLNDDQTITGHTVRADGSLQEIHRSKTVGDCDLRISLAPMKTHRDIGVSLAVANWSLGTWVVPPRIGTHGRVWARFPWLQNEGITAYHATIAQLFSELPCHLAIVDAVQAMEGAGPIDGTPVAMNLVLAGLDAVAVDAVGATLMGFDPPEIGYLVSCNERGLGVNDMSKIDVPPLQVEQLRRQFIRT